MDTFSNHARGTAEAAVPARAPTGGTPVTYVAIVAALEREIGPFVKGWASAVREYDGHSFRFFQKENTVVVCGGVGAEAARRAAEAVIGLYQPGLLISAGFAGALDPALAVGHVLTPREIVDAGDGSRMDAGSGEGILITFDTVADVEQKARFASAFGAHAIDMEAAAVGKSAQARGIKFLACKVISDSSDSSLPPLTKFIGGDGRFHVLRYALHIAVRPWRWAAVRRLARDSMTAAKALGVTLEKHSQRAT
jgi:adenosylhomocysteine nucleosidase